MGAKAGRVRSIIEARVAKVLTQMLEQKEIDEFFRNVTTGGFYVFFKRRGRQAMVRLLLNSGRPSFSPEVRHLNVALSDSDAVIRRKILELIL